MGDQSNMLRTIRHLLEMIRFSHTLFALPFPYTTLFRSWTTPLAANHSPHTTHHSPPIFDWRHLLGLLICMVGARSAAMAFNRLVDRWIDAANPRTSSRHLPAGVLSATSVWLFTLVSPAVFVAGRLLFLPNRLPVLMSLPVLLFLLGYSYAKRFTALAHFLLGTALMLAPTCAWIAIRGEALLANPADVLPAALLGAAVLAWVSGFDIIYACQDAEFDRQAHLKSVPALVGVTGALRLAAACHLATIVLLAALPLVCPQLSLGWIYGAGVAAVAALLIYEHSLVRPDDLTRVNVAFFNINVIISLGLIVICTGDMHL